MLAPSPRATSKGPSSRTMTSGSGPRVLRLPQRVAPLPKRVANPHTCHSQRWTEPVTEHPVRILRLNLTFAYMFAKVTSGAETTAKTKILTEKLGSVPDCCAQFFTKVGSDDIQEITYRTGCHCDLWCVCTSCTHMACSTASRHCIAVRRSLTATDTRTLARTHPQNTHAHLAPSSPTGGGLEPCVPRPDLQPDPKSPARTAAGTRRVLLVAQDDGHSSHRHFGDLRRGCGCGRCVL